jgi:hypothetical protein
MPCFENTCVMNMSAMSMAVAVSVVGMKIHSFDSQSMTTSIAVKPFDGGSCLMKSMLIECHRHSSIGSHCRRLYGAMLGWLIVHAEHALCYEVLAVSTHAGPYIVSLY